jgi:hypothetical protein
MAPFIITDVGPNLKRFYDLATHEPVGSIFGPAPKRANRRARRTLVP